MTGKVLTVLLLVVLLAGGFAVFWSMELAPGKAEDAARLVALERKVKRLEAMQTALEGEDEISFVEGGRESLPIIGRVKELEKRVGSLEDKGNGNSGPTQKIPIFSNQDDAESTESRDNPKKISEKAAEGVDSGVSALEELAEQDREHIKGAIREVISEERDKQKLSEYEAGRDKYRKQIVDQLRNVAKQLKLTDFQKESLQGLLGDMFARLDREAENARIENNPALIEEAKVRLTKELSARAMDLLDAEQLEIVKKTREQRNKP